MMRFMDRIARVDRAIDAEHGETIRVVPRVPGEYMAGGSDPSRPVVNVIGILDLKPAVAKLKDRGRYDGFQPEVEGEAAHVSFQSSVFASRQMWPRSGDHIEVPRLQLRLIIAVVEFDGMSRIICKCAEVGSTA